MPATLRIVAVVLSIALGCALGSASSKDGAPPQHLIREVTMTSGGAILPSKAELMRAESPLPQSKDVRAHGEELLERQTDTEITTTVAPPISCGGHTAPRCRLCTVIDPHTGLETMDRGPDWCHGDCTYYDQECHTLTSYNLKVKRDSSEEGATTTQHVPDLLNPEITDADRKLMDDAADRSIQEADYEAKMRLALQKKEEEAAKDKMNKFLYAVIMSAATMLFCCAIVSCFMLCRFTGKK